MRKAQAVWNRGLQFVATSGSGHAIVIDGSPEDGGSATGPSNTELLLMALCGCTGMDIVTILRKKRVAFDDFEVLAEGEVHTEPPKHFTHIRLTYRIWGDVPESALRQAIELSQEKYCTVSITLKGRAEVTAAYEINPEERGLANPQPPR
jgi:putative redox protein